MIHSNNDYMNIAFTIDAKYTPHLEALIKSICYYNQKVNFYVLHNLEFQKRAWKSEKLLKKYKFFRKYVFTDWEFVTDEYSFKIEKDYIWDTTKLDFDLVKFKKYLEKFDKK